MYNSVLPQFCDNRADTHFPVTCLRFWQFKLFRRQTVTIFSRPSTFSCGSRGQVIQNRITSGITDHIQVFMLPDQSEHLLQENGTEEWSSRGLLFFFGCHIIKDFAATKDICKNTSCSNVIITRLPKSCIYIINSSWAELTPGQLARNLLAVPWICSSGKS